MEQPKPKKKKIVAIAAVAAVCALLIFYITTVYAAPSASDEDTLLREYPVSRGDITAGIGGAGSLSIDGEGHNFSAPVQLEELYIKQGDSVKKGDKLAKASEKALQDKLNELNTLLEKAQINLADAQNNKKKGAVDMIQTQAPGDAGNAEYQSQRAAEQASANELQQQIDSITALIAGLDSQTAELETQIAGINAQIASLAEGDPTLAGLQAQLTTLSTELDTLKAEREKAASQLAEAQISLASANAAMQALDAARNEAVAQSQREANKQNQTNSLAMSGYDNAIRLAEIEVEDIERQIESVKAIQNELYLYAKQDGIVLEVGYTEGSETTLDKDVVSIGKEESLYAQLQVSQADIGNIEEGQAVELNFDAYPERTFTGTVVKKNPLPVKDSNPVSYLVEVSLDPEDADLLSGMTCSGQFIIKQVKDVLQLSNKAIRMGENGQVVLLKDDEGNLYEQPVETGFSDGKFSEIVSGLNEGDIVYVEG
ncbi:efflux RND transporter periplasmic adaptor subunit [Christensenellaceae bacterium OttesenSCG-928-K19]|nr:efflux RND transporter periplasmic adaptor subunit [Christensenellaceae bacterium OttesenSCG-928-K19]